MAENKTKPGLENLDAYLASLSEKRLAEAQALMEMMGSISGEDPVLWGPSIIGFGSTHYKYDSGREGDMPRIAFSPRKANITVYFSEGFDRYTAQMAMLGPHTHSVSCLYIKSLDKVDLDRLGEMVQSSWDLYGEKQQPAGSVEEYVARVPAAAREPFSALRKLVKSSLTGCSEVLSYGLIGYSCGDRKPRIFISAWKDHLAIYPVPGGEELKKDLAPYIHGKSSIWFVLDEPLPEGLIRRIAEASQR